VKDGRRLEGELGRKEAAYYNSQWVKAAPAAAACALSEALGVHVSGWEDEASAEKLSWPAGTLPAGAPAVVPPTMRVAKPGVLQLPVKLFINYLKGVRSAVDKARAPPARIIIYLYYIRDIFKNC